MSLRDDPNGKPESREAPLRVFDGATPELVLTEDIAEFHSLDNYISWWLTTKWATKPRQTSLAWEGRPVDSKAGQLTNTRSVVRHADDGSGRATVRVPRTLISERGITTDSTESGAKTVNVCHPEPERLQVIPQSSLERIRTIRPVKTPENSATFKAHRDGEDKQSVAYRLVIPTRFNELYGMEEAGNSGYGIWKLHTVGHQLALTVTFVDETPSDEVLSTQWRTRMAGYGDEGGKYRVPQTQIIVPRVIVVALQLSQTALQYYPEDDRIVIVPEDPIDDEGSGDFTLKTEIEPVIEGRDQATV